VVFIAALSWWERRRPRQAFAPRLRETSLSHTEFSHAEAYRTASPEPWIGESGLADAALSDEPLHGDAGAHEAGPGPLEELPTLVIPEDDPRLALRALWDEQPPEPTLIDPEAGVAAETPAASEPVAPVLAAEPLGVAEPPQPAEPVHAQELTPVQEPTRAQEPPGA